MRCPECGRKIKNDKTKELEGRIEAIEEQVGPISSDDGSLIATKYGVTQNPDWPWLKKLVKRIERLEATLTSR